MIRYVSGDLFASPAQALVNTVNTVGVMGKGIALTFKKLFPEMFAEYQQLCENQKLVVGSLHIYQTKTKLVVNFPTKTTWQLPSRPEYIEAGLQTFAKSYEKIGITSIAFPPLGCGNGELDFERQVRPLMERYLSPLPITVFIYPPQAGRHAAEHRSIRTMKTWLQTEPQAMPFSEFWDDVAGVLTKSHKFRTIARNSPFEAELVTTEPAIRVRTGSNSFVFRQEEVRELWRELKYHLVATPQSMPPRESEVGYILSILNHLPYIEPIEIANTPSDLAGNPRHGVRLTPRDPKTQGLELALGS